ncbi:hypothetical protein [Parafilimonas sp.]|uniref:hypothetical protein n=1 Tax=Parafilimonas sp. TaxID=1969739 RepID=UPI0039E62A32
MASVLKMLYNKTGVSKIIKRQISIRQELISLNKKSDELCWAMIFNNTIADSTWLQNKSFSPGRWAAGYSLLYLLYRIYNEIKPKNILEFGLGESSKLTCQYNDAFSTSRFCIVEHDALWIDFFSVRVAGIKKHIVLLPIEYTTIDSTEVIRYKNLLDNIGPGKYDMVVIDGPWGSPDYSRYEIIDLVLNDRLAENFIIIMDDYNRTGEKQTIKKLRGILNQKNIPFSEGVYSGIKDVCIICSKAYRFLTSL